MSQVFISHVEEDASYALRLAVHLEQAGYTTWYYERDTVPALDYLVQVGQAIEEAQAFALMISAHSLESNQVNNEVVRAYEENRKFIPILVDITDAEYKRQQPTWRQAIGAATSITIPQQGIKPIIPRIVSGLKALGVQTSQRSDTIPSAEKTASLSELKSNMTLPTSSKAVPPQTFQIDRHAFSPSAKAVESYIRYEDEPRHPIGTEVDRGPTSDCHFIIKPSYRSDPRDKRWREKADVEVKIEGKNFQGDPNIYLIPSANAPPDLAHTDILRKYPRKLELKRDITVEFVDEVQKRMDQRLEGKWFMHKGFPHVYSWEYDAYLTWKYEQQRKK